MDIRLCGPFYWVTQGMLIVYPLYIYFKMMNIEWDIPDTHPFGIITTTEGLMRTSLTYALDFLFPLLMAFSIFLLFSATYEDHSGEYLYSLPISRFFLTVGRWSRLLLTFLPGYVLNLIVCWWAGNPMIKYAWGMDPIPLWYWVRNSMPSVLFVCGLALFLMVVGKKLFYAVTILGGLLLVELLSDGLLLGKWTFFFNLRGDYYTLDILVQNRVFYSIAGIVLALLAYILSTANFYKKRI